MKASEIVEALYEGYIKGKIGPRAVGKMRGEMSLAARKGGSKAAAKVAIGYFKKYEKDVPIALVKIMKGTKKLEVVSKDDDDEAPKKTLKKKVVTTKPAAKSAKAEEHINSIGKMPAGVVLKPAIITIRPEKLEKVALRAILKTNRVAYEKEDDEEALRAKLVKLLKKASSLPVVDYSKMESSQEIAKSGSCFGVLIDLAGSMDCIICPTQVECQKQFSATFLAKPAVKEKEEEAEEEDEDAEEEDEDEKAEADEDEEEAEEEDEDAEVAEEDAEEEAADEDEEEAEEEDEEEKAEDDEDVEEEEDEETEEEEEKKPGKAAKGEVTYKDDTVIKLLQEKPPVEKDHDLYEPLKKFLKGAPKKTTFGAIREMLTDTFDAKEDEILTAAVQLTTQLVTEKAARILTPA